jgi:hypothetical protein
MDGPLHMAAVGFRALQGPAEDDEPVVFTFYWDVASNPGVIKAMLQLNQSIQKAISGVSRYVEGWRRHSTLWKTDKARAPQDGRRGVMGLTRCHGWTSAQLLCAHRAALNYCALP